MELLSLRVCWHYLGSISSLTGDLNSMMNWKMDSLLRTTTNIRAYQFELISVSSTVEPMTVLKQAAEYRTAKTGLHLGLMCLKMGHNVDPRLKLKDTNRKNVIGQG